MDITYEIANAAIQENEAWTARNAARLAFVKFVRELRDEAGEYVDRTDIIKWGEPEQVEKYDNLKAAWKEAQRILQNKRAATRRIIAVLTK